MARVRFMSWNIQNYGTGSRYTRGPISTWLNRFIASVVAHYNVDVFAIMELTPRRRYHLSSLLGHLNDRAGRDAWCFDYLPGSVALTGHAGEQYVQSVRDLDWRSGAQAPRREGYAFFWNYRSDQFRMLPARRPMSYGTRRTRARGGDPAFAASLSLTERQTRIRTQAPRLRAAAGIDPGANQLGNWEPSYFPDVSTYYGPNVVFWALSRRPAYVVIELAGDGPAAQRLVPLMVYHAPSRRAMANLGTYLAGLSQELYAMNGLQYPNWQPNLVPLENAIAAGDYNAPVGDPSSWDNYYTSFYSAFGQTYQAGAQLTPIYQHDQTATHRTTVQLRGSQNGIFNGAPITSGNPTDYMFGSIDQLFHGLTDGRTIHSAQILRITEELTAGGALTGQPVQHFTRPLEWALWDAHTLDPDSGPEDANGTRTYSFLSPQVTDDWQNLRNGVNAGVMPDARSAAVLYRGFVSDHFPLLIDFEV